MRSYFVFVYSVFAVQVWGAVPQVPGCFTNLTSAAAGIACSDCLAQCSATTALCAPACARGWKVDGCSVSFAFSHPEVRAIDLLTRRVSPAAVSQPAGSASQNANGQMVLALTARRQIRKVKCSCIERQNVFDLADIRL